MNRRLFQWTMDYRLWTPLLSVLFLCLSFSVTAQFTINPQPSDNFGDSAAHAPPADPFAHHADWHQIEMMPTEYHSTWFFVVIVLQLGLLGYMRMSHPRDMDSMVKALMNLKIAQQLYREQELSMPVSAVLYNINLVISVSVFIFLLNDFFNWVTHASSFITFLFFLWIVIMLYSLKYSIMKFVAQVFPFSHEMNHFSFNFFLFQKVLGLLLIPLNLLIAYALTPIDDFSIYFAIFLAALVMAGAFFKGLRIAQAQMMQNKFHFLLYICTLEIAPVCILIKAAVAWLN